MSSQEPVANENPHDRIEPQDREYVMSIGTRPVGEDTTSTSHTRATDATAARPARPTPDAAPGHRSLSWVLSLAVLGLAGLVLVVMVSTSPTQLVYDERWYVPTISLVHEHGFSLTFLRSVPGLAGPLSTVVQYIFEPLTGGRAPGVRLVNVGFVLLTICSLYGVLRHVRTPARLIAALGLLGVPMTWAMGGLALTEFPAMGLAALATFLLLTVVFKARPSSDVSPGSVAIAAMAGVLFGAAVLGRQPLLVVLAAVPLLLRGTPRAGRVALLAFMVPAVAVPIGVFMAWNGVIPPTESYMSWGRSLALPDMPYNPDAIPETGSISIPFGLLGLGYAAAVVLILAPAFFRMKWQLAFAAIALAFAINAVVPLARITPLRGAVESLLGSPGLTMYGYAAGSALVAAGILFLVAVIRAGWAARTDPVYGFFCVASLFLIGVIATNTAQFSSRYVGSTLPFLIPVIAPAIRVDRSAPFRFALGAILGALSLLSYYSQAGG